MPWTLKLTTCLPLVAFCSENWSFWQFWSAIAVKQGENVQGILAQRVRLQNETTGPGMSVELKKKKTSNQFWPKPFRAHLEVEKQLRKEVEELDKPPKYNSVVLRDDPPEYLASHRKNHFSQFNPYNQQFFFIQGVGNKCPNKSCLQHELGWGPRERGSE